MKKVIVGLLLILMVVSVINAAETLSKEELRIQKYIEKVMQRDPEVIASQFYKMRENERQNVCEAIVKALVEDYRANKDVESFKLVNFLNALHYEHGASKPSTTTFACLLVATELNDNESDEIRELLDPLVQTFFSREVRKLSK